MKYYKYRDEFSPIAPGTEYVETDKGWPIRQIAFNGKEYIASNRRHPLWGLTLGDQQVDWDAIDEVSSISKQEFEKIWNAHLANHQVEWDAIKKAHPNGKEEQGFIVVFFPQGVIVDLGDNTLGLADYSTCLASTIPEYMYSKHKVTAIVGGYDEVNQWIVLESPQVHKENIGEYLNTTNF
jgi:hypothetical protein